MSHLQFFKVGEIMGSKYGHLMLSGYQGHFQIKLPWYWFYRWSSSSVWCSSCKNTFAGAGNLQTITNRILMWTLMGVLCTVSGPSFMHSFSFLRSWNIQSASHPEEIWVQRFQLEYGLFSSIPAKFYWFILFYTLLSGQFLLAV